MTRSAYTLIVFATLAAWASAQPTPRADDRLRLLQVNQSLLEDLLEHGLKLSQTGNKLDQADECRNAMTTLGRVLTNVTSDPSADPDRIAELSDQLSELVTDGLAPTLAEVRDRVKSGSPDGPRLSKIEKQAATDLQTIQSALPTDGRLGQSTKVQASQKKLSEARKLIEGK